LTVDYCINCNGLIFFKKEWISIKYEDFDLNVERDERECAKCTVDYYKSLIKRNYESSVFNDGKRSINFQEYCEIFKSKGRKITELTHLLYATNVLSFRANGNYALIKSSFFLNPTLNNQMLYFCDLDIITKFAKTCFSCSSEICIIKIQNSFFPNQNNLN